MTDRTYHPPDPKDLPHVPPWNPPAPTKESLDWADLHTIELSDLDSPDPKVVAALIATTKTAIKNDGFLYVTNYGLDISDLHRQFALAQYTHANITPAEREELLWDPSTGSFAGFKPGTGWTREKGATDGIEQFNFYNSAFLGDRKVPSCIDPFMNEIRGFTQWLRDSVTRRLFVLLSRILELPDQWLWDNVLSRDESPVGEGYFRHAIFYPLEKSVRESREGVRMYGHRDYGALTLLFSVPVTALQVFSPDKKWRFVKYQPGALVINIGEALEIISGGHLKATLHKVADTPPDQQHLQRLSIVNFNASQGSLRLTPTLKSPLLQREGVVADAGVIKEWKALMDAGSPVPTNKEWREAVITTRLQAAPKETLGGIKVVDGVKYSEEKLLGVKIMLPV